MNRYKLNIIKFSFIVLLVNGISLSTYAQKQKDLADEEISFESLGLQIIRKSEKINDAPEIFDTTINAPESEITIIPQNINTSSELDSIKAVKLKTLEPLSQLYKIYIKGGFGSYISPLLDVSYGTLRSKDLNYGVSYHHNSSQNIGIKNIGKSSFANNNFNLHAKKLWREHSIEGNVYYNQKGYHYYGYDKDFFDDFYQSDSLDKKQNLNTIGIKSTFSSNIKDSNKINYSTTLNYQYFHEKNNNQENYLALNFNLNQYYRDLLINIDGEFEYNSVSNNKDDLSFLDELALNGLDNNNFNISLKPHIKLINENWHLNAGFGFVASFTQETNLYAFPYAEFEYNLFDNLFAPYIGIDGDVKRYTLHDLFYQNNFLYPVQSLENKFVPVKLYGGIRGSITSKVTFNVRAEYQSIKNQALFSQDTSYFIGNTFNVLYDDIKKGTLTGQISYYEKEKYKITLEGNYYTYSVGEQDKPWYLPNYDLSIIGLYDLEDKIILELGAKLVGNREAQEITYNELDASIIDLKTITLKPYVDINLKGEYRYTTRMSFFLNLTNLANQKYDIYEGYKVQGIQVMLGATYSFLK